MSNCLWACLCKSPPKTDQYNFTMLSMTIEVTFSFRSEAWAVPAGLLIGVLNACCTIHRPARCDIHTGSSSVNSFPANHPVFFFFLTFILPRFHRYLRNTSFSVFGGSEYRTKPVLVPLLSCNAKKKNKCPPWIYRNTFLYICHSPWIKYLFSYYFEELIILANNHILKYQELKQKQQKVVYFPYNFPLRIWECSSVIEHLPRISVALGSRSRTEKIPPNLWVFWISWSLVRQLLLSDFCSVYPPQG